jgi:hypothetical protein
MKQSLQRTQLCTVLVHKCVEGNTGKRATHLAVWKLKSSIGLFIISFQNFEPCLRPAASAAPHKNTKYRARVITASLWTQHMNPYRITQQDRQGTFKRNFEARSFIHCSSGKAMRYILCVAIVLAIQHAMCMCHVIISGLLGSTIFFHIISRTALF